MAELPFDAFLSYARHDRRVVRRIQSFLETYTPPGRRNRLSVYRDETDMRGGSLPDNLARALAQSRSLVVCWSDKAAESDWVSDEVNEFRRLGREKQIAVVHVGGGGPTTITHKAFTGIQPIEHDLRNGWWGPVKKPRAKLELLRLMSFLTNAEMRELRNWACRRQLRNIALTAVPLAAALGILFWPTPSWTPLQIVNAEQPARPVACEVVDGKLWAASWYEAAGETSGARAYFETSSDVIAGLPLRRPPSQSFNLPRRALPASMLDRNVLTRTRTVLGDAGVLDRIGATGRSDARIALPSPDRIVYIQPAPHGPPSLQDLEFQSRDRLPIPETDGSVVVVHRDGLPPRMSSVADLSPPVWRDYPEGSQQRTSPARAISVIWIGENDIWIGVAGERDTAGGLWHSADGGQRWEKIDDFSSVTSLDVRRSSGGTETVVVAEQSFKRLKETSFVAGESRVVERASDGTWSASLAPPFGTSSEIELCGATSDGTRYVRVDGQILRQGTQLLVWSLWSRRRAS